MVDFVIRIIADPRPAKRGNQAVRSELKRTERAADRLGRTIKRALRFAGGVLLIRQLGRLIDQYQVLQNRIRTVTSGQDGLNSTMKELFAIADRTRQPIGALVQLYQRGSIAASELGTNSETLLKFTELVGKALAVQGGNAATSRGALIQLSQAMGQTIVRAEEFNSIQEGALPILQAVARGLDGAGGSVARLRRLVIDGEVSGREFFEAFLRGSGQIERQFDATKATISQALTQIGNRLTDVLGKSAETTGATDQLVKSLQDFAEFVGGSFFKKASDFLFETFARTLGVVEKLITFLGDPSLRNFMSIGEVARFGVPKKEGVAPGGTPPPGGSPPPPADTSKTLQKQIEAANRFSQELETQNGLIFAQIQGNQDLVRELEVRLELESALGQEVLDTQPKIVEAIRRQLEEQQQLSIELERQQEVQQNVRDFARDAFDTFIDGARRGKLSFKDLADSMLSNLARMASNQLFNQLFGGGSTQGGGLFASLFGLGGGNVFGGAGPANIIPGMATGGSLTVGGAPGVDRNVLSLNGENVARVSRGENVNVTPSGQMAGGGIVINQSQTNNFGETDSNDIPAFEARLAAVKEQTKRETLAAVRQGRRLDPSFLRPAGA